MDVENNTVVRALGRRTVSWSDMPVTTSATKPIYMPEIWPTFYLFSWEGAVLSPAGLAGTNMNDLQTDILGSPISSLVCFKKGIEGVSTHTDPQAYTVSPTGLLKCPAQGGEPIW